MTISVVLSSVAGTSAEAALGAVPDVDDVLSPPDPEMAAAIDECGVLVSYLWSDEWLVPGLRWIQSYSAGVEQFPLDDLAATGVVVTSAVGIHGAQVSEHAFGLLLGLTRGIAAAAQNQVSHTWKWPRVVDLDGMTMGVLGLGVIGEAVAAKAKAFGMHVIGTNRTTAGYSGAADEVLGPEATREVCARSDVVIVALPATDETTDIIGSTDLQALEGGYLINVGRGSVIDESALVAALEGRTLAGAGLDVFDEEPLPEDSPLWDVPGLLITPHVAGSSPRYDERLAELFARNLRAYLGEGEWVNRVA